MDEIYQKQLLDTLGAYIYIKNCDGLYIDVNQKFCDLFCLKRDDIIGKRDLELFDHNTARLIEHNDICVLSQKGTIKNKESQYFSMRNEYRYFLSFKTPMFDIENKLLGLCGVSVDISEDEFDKITLEKQVYIDFLTNCFNRRYLEQNMEKEISRSKRDNSLLSIFILDLDYFKQINDDFGHSMGDKVLQIVSEVIQDNLRKEDACCRYGGDEFCILLPNTSAKNAFLVSEKIRDTVASINVTSLKGDDIQISCTIGVANLCDGDNRDSLMQNADSALYFAKEHGRNMTFIQCMHFKSMMRCSECTQQCE